MSKMIKYAVKYRKNNPGKPLRFFFLPNTISTMFWTMDKYDLLFGEAFYNSTWFEDFDQSKVLSEIECPSVLIHTEWSIDDNGILMAAMSEDDAQRAHGLIKNSKIIKIDSGHNAHYEKPDKFIEAMKLLTIMV